MTPNDRWQKVEDLARSALEREPAERAAFLDAVCRDEPQLRLKVDELVTVYETAGGSESTVLSRPGFVPPPVVELEPGDTVGPYRLLERTAKGSMATIYRASRDDRPGVVAVKVARRGFDVACLTQLFQNERDVLERLDHPYVSRLHGGGTLDDGRPYVVVEFVEGLPIHRYCTRSGFPRRGTNEGLPVAARLELFRQVCEAVRHLHERGVVHRDIKPVNVLVRRDGVPKLLDFGIAVHLRRDSGGRTIGTSPSPIDHLMTPQYASPEQVRGGEITPLSDVYSLGVLLYELLTGRLPYGGRGLGPREMARLLDGQEPPPPSAVAECAEVRRLLKGDLDAVVLEAIAQKPDQRPSSADQLAEHVRRCYSRLI